MFVIDPGNDFPVDVWKRISRIQIYRVNEDLVDQESNKQRSPLVNFNAPDPERLYYALRVRRIEGDFDPDPARDDDQMQPRTTSDPNFPLMAYAFSPERGIKGSSYIKAFPDRVRLFVDSRIRWLVEGLLDPQSEAGKIHRKSFSPEMQPATGELFLNSIQDASTRP